jgi:predicted phosphodiesterase
MTDQESKEINNYIEGNRFKSHKDQLNDIRNMGYNMTSEELSSRKNYLFNKRNKNKPSIPKLNGGVGNGSPKRVISQSAAGITSTNVPVPNNSLSPTKLLEFHGLDPQEFELVRLWYNETEPGSGKYTSSIFAKPKFKGIGLLDVVNEIKKNVTPVVLSYNRNKSKYNFMLNFADIHFGITKIKDMKPILKNIDDYFNEQNEIGEVFINLLGDEFHSSQIGESVTLKGTSLDEVDMIGAIKDAKIFFESLFLILNNKAKKITLNRTPGNHDGNMSYMFIEWLQTRFPSVIINNTNDPRTYFKAGNVGVMITHGHNGKKSDYINIFASEGKSVFNSSSTNIVLTGHRHTELVEQNPAATIYQVGSCKAQDKWSHNKGYVGDARTRNWTIMKLDQNEIVGYQYI